MGGACCHCTLRLKPNMPVVFTTAAMIRQTAVPMLNNYISTIIIISLVMEIRKRFDFRRHIEREIHTTRSRNNSCIC
jgi:hypothetical protein